MTETENQARSKKDNPTKTKRYKTDTKRCIGDIPSKLKNISADATLDSSQQETTETGTVTLLKETYSRNEYEAIKIEMRKVLSF